MKYDTLIIEKVGSVMTVILNRPKMLNAFNEAIMVELRDLFGHLRADLKTRFVIFTGAGRAFSAGVEFTRDAIENRYNNPELSNERLWQLFGHDFMHTMENLEQITVAAINGPAMGAGLCLAMNCDIRVASKTALLGVPEANLGVFYTWGATPRLTALIGPAKAKEMILTCDSISADEAWRIGLVNTVVPPDQLMTYCTNLVNKISTKGPISVRIAKKQVNSASIAKMADLYPCEPELVERVILSDEAKEGVSAFIEKRSAKFREPVKPRAKIIRNK